MAGQFQSRIGDYSRGHWVGIFYFPPKPITQGSPDTFSGGINAARVLDAAEDHFSFIGGMIPFPMFIHAGRQCLTGAVNTFINGRKAFRVGDMYNCGDVQDQGLPTHDVGDTAFGGGGGNSGGNGDGNSASSSST